VTSVASTVGSLLRERSHSIVSTLTNQRRLHDPIGRIWIQIHRDARRTAHREIVDDHVPQHIGARTGIAAERKAGVIVGRRRAASGAGARRVAMVKIH